MQADSTVTRGQSSAESTYHLQFTEILNEDKKKS